jgi:aspartate carbamoyltransferase catalytic subunit
MKLALANAVRAEVINRLLSYFTDAGEDVALVNSNTLNFPMVYEGEECFVEVVAKVVKKDSDECYQEREDYQMKLREQAEKKAEREKAAAEKKAKAEAKKKEKEEAKAKAEVEEE